MIPEPDFRKLGPLGWREAQLKGKRGWEWSKGESPEGKSAVLELRKESSWIKIKERRYWTAGYVVISDLRDQFHWHEKQIAVDWEMSESECEDL